MLVYLSNEQETKQVAEKLAKYCPKNKRFIIFLEGELGSGKTTFVRFFLQTLGHSGAVKSPTYTLIETYQVSKQLIFHLDLYRLQTSREIFALGLEDEWNQVAIWLIEWPERALPFLPQADIICHLTLINSHRQVKIQAQTPRGKQLLQRMENA